MSTDQSNKKTSKKQKMLDVLPSFLHFIVFLVPLYCIFNCYFIDQGEKAVVTRFGKFSEIWIEGINFKLPFVDSVNRYPIRVQKTVISNTDDIDQKTLSAYSKDLQLIERYSIVVIWNYDSEKIKDLYQNYGISESNSLFQKVVAPTILQLSNSLLGKYTAQDIVQDREKINNEFETKSKVLLKGYPIKFISVQIDNICFSKDYEKAMKKISQKKLEIKNARFELKLIELESQYQVVKAESEIKVKKLKSEAEAYQISEIAKALKVNKSVVDWKKAEKWDGVSPQFVFSSSKYDNQFLPFLNICNTGK